MASTKVSQGDLDYLFDILSVAAHACNRRLREFLLKLDDIAQDDYSRSAILYEFFFHQPFERGKASRRAETLLLAPFVARLFIGWPTMPDPKRSGELIPTTEQALATLRPVQRLKDTMFAEDLVKCWSLPASRSSSAIPNCVSTDDDKHRYLTPSLSKEVITNKLNNSTNLRTEGNVVEVESRRWSRILERSLHALLPDDELYHVILPIAGDELLFGELWLGLPASSKPRLEANITQLIAELQRLYVPVLALVHQHFWEWLQKKKLEGVKSKGPAIVSYRNPFATQSCSESPEVLLQAFYRLAVARREISTPSGKEKQPRFWAEKGEKEAIKKSLLFAKYVISSPQMVDLLRRVASTGERLAKQKTSLPSVLVVGGAGSGKDAIAGLLRMFSPRYRNGRHYIVNMAAMKPDTVAAAAIVGAEKGLLGSEAPVGLLRTLRKDALDYIVKHVKSARTPSRGSSLSSLLKKKCRPRTLNGSRFPTLMLDELNSLPTDSQGVLLRFLENSEIVAIGSPGDSTVKIRKWYSASKPEDIAEVTDFLVVGIMNEDPDALTMENAIETLRSERYVGGAMGDWLYDVFSRARRLRADLKYRLVRDGKFVIPDLKERREEIPILFYLAVRINFESQFSKDKTPSFFISPYVYEDLLNLPTTWPGNVRQLQAVARRCVELAMTEKRPNHDNQWCITTLHLRPVVDQMVLKVEKGTSP